MGCGDFTPPVSGSSTRRGFSHKGARMPDRAILFVDGNNWYHGLRAVAVDGLGRLDYAAISTKLVGPRLWSGTRYYIGRIPQQHDPAVYAAQRRFLANLKATDRRITVHLGRLESRMIGRPGHPGSTVLVEKAVDVMIAVDMVVMAMRNEFEAAYLLSADGDFTPAVEAVRATGKRVYVASPVRGARLAMVADTFIPLGRGWFTDCYR